MQYYSLKKILELKAQYNVIFGERSNGKTYAVLEYGLKQYVASGHQMAIVRRWRDDFIGKRGSTMFESLVTNGVVSSLTNGEWDDVYYYSSRWYLCRKDDDGKRVIDEKPFAYGFAISTMEHDKSTSYTRVTTIMFDEFITRTSYLPDEFVLFMNVISTIVRQRRDVTIFMLGNTVNKYCPYFVEMGLQHVKDMEQGTIDIYRYGESELTVAVEFTAKTKSGKKSDLYFAFDNPKLEMITGGVWELDIYPHCPTKYLPKEVIFKYYIEFGGKVLECEVISHEGYAPFTFVHEKTTELEYRPHDLIFTSVPDARPNVICDFFTASTGVVKALRDFYDSNMFFYSTNEVGDVIMNYRNWAKKK